MDADAEGKTFKGQIGRPVLPPFITIVDDPTLGVLGGKSLNGFYRYDDEGIPAQRVPLVEAGVLRNFLLSRHPVDGFLHSNGHGRAQANRRPVARMANLIASSTKQVSDAELKDMLIAEAKRQGKPYGLIIRDIQGGNTNTSSFGYQAFKGIPRLVYRVDVRDGKESLVRGVEVVGTPLSAISKIVATGKTQGVFNGFCGAESGNVPVSTVAPATLLREIRAAAGGGGARPSATAPEPGERPRAAGRGALRPPGCRCAPRSSGCARCSRPRTLRPSRRGCRRRALWDSLGAVSAGFDASHRLGTVAVAADGTYRVE